MKRKAAVLAMVGWYLIIPPNTSKYPVGQIGDTHKALSCWQPAMSFDTAKECEKVKIERWFPGSRCVATDDPRLKNDCQDQDVW